MNEQQSQTFFVKVDSLSTIRNNKFMTPREKLETVIAKVRVFVSNISSLPLSDIKDMGFRYVFVMHVGGLHVFNKNLKVCIYILTKKCRNNLLFSYYEL